MAAKEYCERKRHVQPVSYTEKKQKAVHHLRELDCIKFKEDEESESKKKLRAEIEERIKGMNGLVFDFDDSDLDEIQDVIGANSEDEDEAFITETENHPIDSTPYNTESVNSAGNSMAVATCPTTIAMVDQHVTENSANEPTPDNVANKDNVANNASSIAMGQENGSIERKENNEEISK